MIHITVLGQTDERDVYIAPHSQNPHPNEHVSGRKFVIVPIHFVGPFSYFLVLFTDFLVPVRSVQPNLSPIYIPDRLSDRSARPMTEGSMASNDGSALPASTTIGPHKLAPSDTNGASTTPSRLVTSPSMLSEVSRLYEEILHTAEGGRLGESTVQVWRSFTDRAGQTDNVSMHFIDVNNPTITESNFSRN